MRFLGKKVHPRISLRGPFFTLFLSAKFVTLNSMRSKGKVAVVTGGSRGIGRATAIHLATHGYLVVALATNGEALAKLSEEYLSIIGYPADLTNEALVDLTFNNIKKKHGRIDILVHCAATFHSQPVVDIPFAIWKQEVHRNVDMLFLTNRAAVRIMGEQQSGTVINLSSRGGLREEVLAGSASYSTHKNGMIGFGRAMELDYPWLKVATLCPGSVDTDMGRQAAAGRPDEPLAGVLTSEQVAEAIRIIIEQPTHQLYRLTVEEGLEGLVEVLRQKSWEPITTI